MIIKHLKSWGEFEPRIEKIISEYGTDGENENRILYRGQADSGWNLVTTLERYGITKNTVRNYLDISSRCAPQIESFTGKDLHWLKDDNIIKEINNKSNLSHLYLPVYEYWVYLRHNGFPSPFLDWTFSPFIAAFFAYAEQNIEERCSIYVYIERPNGSKTTSNTCPRINVFGPYTKAHERHFLQQSWYSVALKKEKTIVQDSSYCDDRFVSHEDVFKKSIEGQDLIIKITLPRTERIEVLEFLNKFNLNHFSLFNSERSLLQTLAFKEITQMSLQ